MNEGGRLSANRLRAGATTAWSRVRGLGLCSRLCESELAMGLGGGLAMGLGGGVGALPRLWMVVGAPEQGGGEGEAWYNSELLEWCNPHHRELKMVLPPAPTPSNPSSHPPRGAVE